MTLHTISDAAAVQYGDPERLVVMFSSMPAYKRGTYDYLDYSKELPYTILFLRDKEAKYGYHAGLDGLTDSVESTTEFLKYFIKKLGPKRVTFFGTSIGGFAATLFGYLVGVDDVHVVSSVSFIDPKIRDELGGGERFEGAFDPVRMMYMERGQQPQYQDCRAIIEANPDAVKVMRMHYTTKDEVDVIQAKHLEGLPNVQLIPSAIGQHRYLGAILLRQGTITRDLETSVEDLSQSVEPVA